MDNLAIANDCKLFLLENGYRPGADEVVRGDTVANFLDQLVPAIAKLKPEHRTQNIIDLRNDVADGVDFRMAAPSAWNCNRTNAENITTVLLLWLWLTARLILLTAALQAQTPWRQEEHHD